MKKLQAIKPDNLRPYTRFAQVKDGRVVVVNAHVLVIQPAQYVFGEDIPADTHFYFELKHWAEAKMPNARNIAVEENCIRNVSNGLRIDTLSAEQYAAAHGRYPDWASVLPTESQPEALSDIGLNPELALQAVTALGVSPDKVRFTFFGHKKGMILESSETEGFALVMPVYISGEMVGGFFDKYLKPENTEAVIAEGDSLEPGDL